MTGPAIMAYGDSTDTLTSYPSAGIIPDWNNNRMFALQASGTPGSAGVRAFVGYDSGSPIVGKTATQMGITSGVNSLGIGVATKGGNLIFPVGGGSNSCQIAEVNATTLELITVFGINSASTSSSTSSRILSPYTMAGLRYGAIEFVISTPIVGFKNEVCILTVPALANSVLGSTDETQAVCGPGVPGTTQGTGFVLGKRTDTGYTVPNTDPVGIYRIVVSASGQSFTKSGTVSPAQVDATWTKFNGAVGICTDQTDGNPIIAVSSNDAVTNHAYLVKVNATTAAVIWTCHIPSDDLGAFADKQMSKHYIGAQKLYLCEGTAVYTFNTSAGTVSSTTASILAPQVGISEDTFGSVTAYGSWLEGSTHPTYFGQYMGTEANHSVTSMFMRWFPGYPPVTPPPPDPPVPMPNPGVSLNRAWTYTMDGHTFYVLDLGDEGTFAYDITTGEWTQYQTHGLTNFHLINGTQWGIRVVGGDLVTSDLWEMVPSATKDTTTGPVQVDIDHAAVGILTTRQRRYYSVESLRIMASYGYLQDSAGVNFTLKFSDDWGNSWVTMSNIALAEGDYTSEIAWRSLGAFTSPGRIFLLTDSGGPIRLDGADAQIDDFDTDNPPPGETNGKTG